MVSYSVCLTAPIQGIITFNVTDVYIKQRFNGVRFCLAAEIVGCMYQTKSDGDILILLHTLHIIMLQINFIQS